MLPTGQEIPATQSGEVENTLPLSLEVKIPESAAASTTLDGDQDAFESARDLFLEGLSDGDRALVLSTKSPQSLLDDLEADKEAYIGHSITYKCIAKLKPAIVGFERFGKALDVICNVYPTVLSLLWGSLRVVIQVARSFNDFFENIIDCIHIISVHLARIRRFETMFPDSAPLKATLVELYTEVLSFCLDARQLFADLEIKTKRKLLVKRRQTTLQGLWSTFSTQFEHSKDDIAQLVNRIDKEAIATGLGDAKANQDQQVEWWKLQELEREDAKQHRIKEQHEIEEQEIERGKQGVWREASKSVWQEQETKSSAVIDLLSVEARSQFFQWLAPLNIDANHEAASKLHYSDTCSWIFTQDNFSRWLTEQDLLLWVVAIPGAGKTVLTSSVIRYLQAHLLAGEALAFYYFDYRKLEQQSAQKLLATIISALASQNPLFFAAIEARVKSARTMGKGPSTALLMELLAIATTQFSKIYLIIDALDECTDRDKLFEFLPKIPTLAPGKLKLFATSRNYIDIQEAIQPIPHLAISMEESLVQPDIEKFVEAEVSAILKSNRIKLRDPKLSDVITTVLSTEARGMFQWVKCQLDQVCKLKSDKAIKASLTKLPHGLDETYLRVLQQLVNQNSEDEIAQIQRMLRWLVHSLRPLTLEELAEAIAIDAGQEDFDASAVLTDPLDLLKYGESLIVLKAENEQQFVQLSHFSVKEFLISEVVRKERPEFYMGAVDANSEIARVCLTHLCFSSFAVPFDQLESSIDGYALHQYACTAWVEHYRQAKDYPERPAGLVSQLLAADPVPLNFQSLCRSYGVYSENYHPIHYCAVNGLLEQLKIILDGGCDMYFDGDPYGTPLNFAVKHQQMEIIQHLLDRGADSNICKIIPPATIGNNSLHWALDENHVAQVPKELIWLLLDAIIPPDVNKLGGVLHPQMPIHYAARSDRLDIMELLVNQGAEIDAVDYNNQSALSIAVEEGAIDVASYLLDHGASLFKDSLMHCDSIRESPFSNTELEIGVSSAMYDVVAALKTQRDLTSGPSHWGFELGLAARDGKLDPLRRILDINIDSKALRTPSGITPASAESGIDGEAGQESLSNAELEARIGTMFSALAPAFSNGHLDVIAALLNRMLAVLVSLQGKVTDLSYEIHQLFTYDQGDSPYCAYQWDQSMTYLSILIAYLKLARSLNESNIKASVSAKQKSSKVRRKEHMYEQDALFILRHGWPAKYRKRRTGLSSGVQERFLPRDKPSEVQAGPYDSFAKAKSFCERARIFWHGKRNTRRALALYLQSIQPPVKRLDVLDFFLNSGCDANCLDRAGKTPHFWANVFGYRKICAYFLSYGGLMHETPAVELRRIQSSIKDAMAEIKENQEAYSATSVDLSRKSDWNNLGHYLYFGGDFNNAIVAFEMGVVFDLASRDDFDPPVFHYFACDACHPLDYREETLIHGYRLVVRDSWDAELCESCSLKFHIDCLRIPSPQWVQKKREFYQRMQRVFKSIDETGLAIEQAEKMKARWKMEATAVQRGEMLAWIEAMTVKWDDAHFEGRLETFVGILGVSADMKPVEKPGSTFSDFWRIRCNIDP